MRKPSFHSAWLVGDRALSVQGSASGIFPWWSFTKSVLAIAALRLVEAGKLELDTLRPHRPYTLRQLLMHRAGVPNYGKLEAYHRAVADNENAWSRERLLAEARADMLDFEPGTGWAYSNIGYLFVRDAIEDAARLPLGQALSELVFAPLRLDSVRLATRREDLQDAYWPRLRSYDPGWVYHGLLVGSPADAARLLHATFAGHWLGQRYVMALIERQVRLEVGSRAGPWTECAYALGLMTGRMGDVRAIGHSGAGPGSVSAVYHFPDLDLPTTVATFANGEDDGQAELQALTIALRA
jgi:CubicO group peptidase (beta-lactamase class C family)